MDEEQLPLNDGLFMERAIAVAQRSPHRPFGAVLVDRDQQLVVAEGFNRTPENPLWHGEVDAINQLASQQPAFDNWFRLCLYSTAEPCPMCQASILWAGIERVVFGVSIPQLREFGWSQIEIRAEEIVRRAPFVKCEITGGVKEAECASLFRSCGPPQSMTTI